MNSHSKRLLGLAFSAFLLAACATFWKVAPPVLKTTECALDRAHKKMPWPQIIVECGVTPENEQAILDLIEQQQAQEAAIRQEAACKW